MYSTWSHKDATLASTLGGQTHCTCYGKTFPQFCKRLKMMTAQTTSTKTYSSSDCNTAFILSQGEALKVFPKLKRSSHLTNTCMGTICPECTPTSPVENKLMLHWVYQASTFRTGAAHTENEHPYLDCIPKPMTVLGLRHLVLWADSASSIILLLCKKLRMFYHKCQWSQAEHKSRDTVSLTTPYWNTPVLHAKRTVVMILRLYMTKCEFHQSSDLG